MQTGFEGVEVNKLRIFSESAVSRDRSGVISGLYILQADNDRDFSQWKRHILAIVDDQNYNSLQNQENREINNDFTPGNNHLICH